MIGRRDSTGRISARSAVAAVEFALVCVPFVTFLLAVMVLGFNYYVQQALDYSTQDAARQIQIGKVPANYTEADFLNKVFCPSFGYFQMCANIFVDLHPVADFQTLSAPGTTDGPTSTNTNGYTFCPGAPGQMMYLHTVYLAPLFGGTLLNTQAGATSLPLVANAAFANENPTGIAVSTAGGC